MLMSKVAISYSSLRDAKGEAKALSRKLDKYADNLDSQVYRKLTSYSGNSTSNITNAKSQLRSKISNLRDASTNYGNYANDIQDLKDECVSVDKAVRTKISKLTASFKKANGIRNSKIENGFYYIGASIGNFSAGSRWVNDKLDEGSTGLEYIKDALKEWYNYEGGKEFLKGVLVGLLEGAIALLTIIGAICTGGALIAVIAGVVAGVIALVNAGVNIYNEFKAYRTTNNGDPATARRYSREDSFQDMFRTEAKYNSKNWQIAAGVVDVVNIVCSLIQLGDGIKNLFKKGYKWAKGDLTDINELKFKDIFKKDSFKLIGNKIKDTFKNGFSDIFKTIKTGDWTKIGKSALDFGSDFKENLLNRFADGKWYKVSKNWLSGIKDLITDGVTFKGIMENIVMPSINMGDYASIKGEGQLEFDFDSIKMDNFYDIYKKSNKIITNDLWNSGDSFDINILDKLSEISNINISVPDIHIPEVKIPPVMVNVAA